MPEKRTHTPALARLIAQAYQAVEKTDDADLVGNALCDCQDVTEFGKP